MSYCRWSSDNFQCDVYCYEDVRGGFTTHIASNRPDFQEPLPDPVPMEDFDGRVEYRRALNALLDRTPYKKIGLEYDGQTFNDPDLHKFRSRLAHLKDVGYHVPDSVFDVIDEEMTATGQTEE